MADMDKNIEKYIQMLQSPMASSRYEACEYLRSVSAFAPEAITPEAIAALQNASKDSDAEVAEAAQRALDVQLRPEPVVEPVSSGRPASNRVIVP